jgi:hypothetical protein
VLAVLLGARAVYVVAKRVSKPVGQRVSGVAG